MLPTFTKKSFVRTSFLIDIHNKGRSIVFVLMSDSQDKTIIGGHEYTVPRVDRFDTVPAGTGPIVVDADPIIDQMLRRVLTAPECLRAVFERYAGMYFPTGLDWMEVDNLATVLKVRWHNRMSVSIKQTSTGKVKEYRYIPNVFGRQSGIALGAVDDEDYYSGDVVTSLDQIFVTREQSRQCTALRIGKWNSMAELGIVSGLTIMPLTPKTKTE